MCSGAVPFPLSHWHFISANVFSTCAVEQCELPEVASNSSSNTGSDDVDIAKEGSGHSGSTEGEKDSISPKK